MGDWTAGYVTDVSYAASFHSDLTPQHLAFICLMNGYLAPQTDRPLTYCELGCGLGTTTCMVATGHPDSLVFGVDFNPAHIAEAEALGRDAGIDNVRFLERSFAELLDDDRAIPDCDIITLHGVYTWIAREDQLRIVEILRRKLRPGGIVYVSYNALPGWSGVEMLQRLLHDVGRTTPGRSDHQFDHGLSFAKALREAGVPRFKESEILDSILDIRNQGLLPYLSHEYMNEHWQPMFHHDMARDLAAAKLNYIGSSHALANFPDLNISAEGQTLVNGVGDPDLRETLRDYFAHRLLRRDVYVRGARRITRARQAEAIGAMRLALTRDRSATTRTMTVPIGHIEVEQRVFEPVFDALAAGPKTLNELLAVADTADKTGSKAVEIAGLIIGSSQGAPALPEAAVPSPERARRLNDALARRAVDKPIGAMAAMATPVLGSGVPVTGLEIRVWHALHCGIGAEPEPIARAIWAPLAAEGETLIKDGVVITTEEQALQTLNVDVAQILDRRCPVWRQLGAL